ncbi:uncharacterized protein VNE69_06189 [Vairimorpha necatrix]|uniref:Uncharacterized protein n=1 Tax=Vairimorpha necatrix TaxID=6039 RepID=A0AAX4JDN4_9MICR
MIQNILLTIYSVIRSSTLETDYFPCTIYKPDETRKRKLDNSDESDNFYERITPIEKIYNYKYLPSNSGNSNNLYLEYINKGRKILILDMNELQNFLDYKSLKKKLHDQIDAWDQEDNNKIEIKCVLKDIETNEIKIFRKAKLYIQRRFQIFYTSYQKYINTVKTAISIVASDEYSDNLKDQIDFFDSIFYFLKTSFNKKLYCKLDSYKIIDFYSTLPIRFNVFKDVYYVVERFEIFKIFIEYKYFIKFNENDKNKLQNALYKIYKNLDNLFEKLNKICENCLIIIENLEKVITDNES